MIVELDLLFVLPQIPIEAGGCQLNPFFALRAFIGFDTGADHGGCFERLLIVLRFAAGFREPALIANGGEPSIGGIELNIS